jgi:hypothetical protein
MDNKTSNFVLVARLKQARLDQGLSYQTIIDKVLATGGSTSMGTVRRVFSDDVDPESFSMYNTLRPIAIALLGEDYDAPSKRDIQIEALEEQLEWQREENRRHIEHYNNLLNGKDKLYLSMLDTYARLLEDCNRTIEERDKRIRHQRRLLYAAVGGIMFLLVVMIVAMAIDFIDPNIGYFLR